PQLARRSPCWPSAARRSTRSVDPSKRRTAMAVLDQKLLTATTRDPSEETSKNRTSESEKGLPRVASPPERPAARSIISTAEGGPPPRMARYRPSGDSAATSPLPARVIVRWRLP